MKKSILVVISCTLCIIIFQAFSISEKPEFENLQILPKDISEHDLDSVMHHFSQSLGVKCNFCHVKINDSKKMDFMSDEKPEKKIARKMMLMAIDINKNYFAKMEMDHDMDMGNMNKSHDTSMVKDSMNNSCYMLKAVNCYTCHRGDSHPESKLPAPPEGPPAPPQQTPADKK